MLDLCACTRVTCQKFPKQIQCNNVFTYSEGTSFYESPLVWILFRLILAKLRNCSDLQPKLDIYKNQSTICFKITFKDKKLFVSLVKEILNNFKLFHWKKGQEKESRKSLTTLSHKSFILKIVEIQKNTHFAFWFKNLYSLSADQGIFLHNDSQTPP